MKRLLLTAIFLPAIFLFSCSEAPAQRKLLVLGSSTASCGWGITVPDSCYVYRLRKYYADRGFPIEVDNRSAAGFDVYTGMPTNFTPPPGRQSPLPGQNITDGLKGNPDVVIVNYPSNGYDVFTVREVMFCFRTIKQTANAAGKPCYIMTTQPRWAPMPFRTSPVKKVMAEIKDSVLAEFGQYAINFWDGLVNPADTTILPQYDSGDSTHPNNSAHALLAQRVIEKNIFNLALPVKLVSFNGTAANKASEIEWTVSDENDIRSYSLEKSLDGRSFSKIYEVSAINSEKLHSYGYSDVVNFGLSAFYRLGIVGKDNFVNYSNVLLVKGNSDVLEKLYQPDRNQIVAVINARRDEPMKASVFNASGQLLIEHKTMLRAGLNTVSVGVQRLQKGLYYIRFSGQEIDIPAKSFSKR